jgi:hypothetical protein
MASKQHFTTLHTWAGLCALVGFVVIATGGVMLYCGLPKQYKKYTGQLSRIHKAVSIQRASVWMNCFPSLGGGSPHVAHTFSLLESVPAMSLKKLQHCKIDPILQ